MPHHHGQVRTLPVAPAAFIQSASGIFNRTNTATATLAVAPVLGDLLIATVSCFSSTVVNLSSGGGTWTLVEGTSKDAGISWSTNTTVTTITATGDSATTRGGLIVLHFTGSVASPFDVGNYPPPVLATNSAGPITPTGNGAIIVTAENTTTARTGSPTGYTALAEVSDYTIFVGAAYLIQTVAAATNPSWTVSPSTSQVDCSVAAFKNG